MFVCVGKNRNVQLCSRQTDKNQQVQATYRYLLIMNLVIKVKRNATHVVVEVVKAAGLLAVQYR